jgi:hypothetical protein
MYLQQSPSTPSRQVFVLRYDWLLRLTEKAKLQVTESPPPIEQPVRSYGVGLVEKEGWSRVRHCNVPIFNSLRFFGKMQDNGSGLAC